MIRNLKIKNKNNHRVWFLLFLLTLNITFPMGNNFLLSLTKCLCPDVDHLLTLERTNIKVHNFKIVFVYFDPRAQWDRFSTTEFKPWDSEGSQT